MLVNEKKMRGTYDVKFDASALASGACFYQLQARQIDGGQEISCRRANSSF